MPSPRRMVAGPRCTGKRGGLSIENGEEGCASPTAAAANSEFAAHGGNNMSATHGRNNMPKIPDVGMRSRSFAWRCTTRAETTVDRASSTPADALGGHMHKHAATPSPTPGGHSSYSAAPAQSTSSSNLAWRQLSSHSSARRRGTPAALWWWPPAVKILRPLGASRENPSAR